MGKKLGMVRELKLRREMEKNIAAYEGLKKIEI